MRLVVALLVAVLAVPSQAAPAKGTLTHGSYTEPGGLTRTYLQYVPTGLKPHRPVVVFLHGCNQTAQQAMVATGWNALADKEKVTVVYPDQVRPASGSYPVVDGNGLGCWNWFHPDHQSRGAGEPAVIAGLAKAVTRAVKGDAKRVYLEGISAGADMTVNVAASYPEVFAAVGSIAGCAYRTCGDTSGELTHTAMGERARVVPMIVENGTVDVLNPFAQSEHLAQSWLGADDLADDGEANLSISREPATTEHRVPSGTPAPGTGDPCLHYPSFGCAGGVLGLSDYPVTVRTWNDAKGRDVLELWEVHGMAHAQPHAPHGEPYTDPLGPDMTAESFRFFLQHSL